MEENRTQKRKDYYREDAYLRAEKRLKAIKGFYWHAFWYLIINIFLIVFIGIKSSHFWSFGTFSTAVFWGIGLGFHALGVFGKNLFFSKSWEDRKIKEYMEKDKNRRNKL